LKDKENKYTFKVAMDANKIEIKKAIEELFKVRVEKVNTMIVKPKPKRRGWFWGYTARWKKAIEKLKEGDKIPVFEV